MPSTKTQRHAWVGVSRDRLRLAQPRPFYPARWLRSDLGFCLDRYESPSLTRSKALLMKRSIAA
jgi:hypothetical protein